MFSVQGDKITITRGDTAALTVRATNKTFASADRAIFTIATKGGETKFSQEYELNNGNFAVQLTNAITSEFEPGVYKWQVRYVVSPVRTDGAITDGSEVKTPKEPQDFVVLGVLTDI
jgi:hypothetical protein